MVELDASVMRGGAQDDCQSNSGFAAGDSTRRNFIFDSAPSTSGMLAIEAPPGISNSSASDGTKNDESSCQEQTSSLIIRSDGYTGLVNQAMTCYLNSLLQTLFMTPEFRNAVYRWESVSKDDEAKSIPYQLQKLFLLLQTSDKPALETKDLTRSFGWDSSHAWDQHDVQELCRVMFDALEHTWRKTSRAMIINDLYQGTIKDYVKCLDCLNENSKDDVFLDLPLAVKPFGSQQAFSTVLEALQYFVHPEVLEGSNQYQCSNCRKKCNAHKGLKITKFPYLLTIQLKRFDFDYTTLHRIKLNDRMTFPDVLNLNPFIDAGSKTHARRRQLDNESLENNLMERADYLRPRRSNTEPSDDHNVPSVSMKNIDENGSPPQDPVPSPSSAVARTLKRNESDDEGICLDSASVFNGGSSVVSPAEPEVNELDPNMINNRLDPALINAYLSEGPYVYELFSIMVHSGSANGGHYYAYIKNLDNKTWYCFNDQVVTRASIEDIRKTYGGSGMHFMYSYSSSTNAYMLMYRKIDPDQNEKFLTSCNFPIHLVDMLKRLSSEEDQQRREEEYQKSLVEMTVNYYHPETGSLSKSVIKIPRVATVDDLIEKCIHEFRLSSYGVTADRCRLVGFSSEKIDPVYDSSVTDKRTISYCNQQIVYRDLLLEIRPVHLKKFRPYKDGGVTMIVSPIFLKSSAPSTSGGEWRMGKPFILYADKDDKVSDVKSQITEFALWSGKNVYLVLYRYNKRLRVLDVMDKCFLDEIGGQLSPVPVYAIVEDALRLPTSEGCSTENDAHCSANILLQSQRLSILSNDSDKIYSDAPDVSALRFIERLKNQVVIKLYLPSVVECREHFFGVNGRMATTDLDSCDDDEIDTEESSEAASEVCEDGAQSGKSNIALGGFGVGFPDTGLLQAPLPAPPPPPPPPPYSPKIAMSVKRRPGIVANDPSNAPPLQSLILQQNSTCTPAPSRSPTPEEPKAPSSSDVQSDFQSQTPAWRFGMPAEGTEASFSMYASTPSPRVSPVSATAGDDEIPSLGDDDDQREKVDVAGGSGDDDGEVRKNMVADYVSQLKHSSDGELRPVTTPTANADDNSHATSQQEEDVDFFAEISFELVEPKPENENDQRIFNVSCDGRMTMQQLKEKVASFINARPDQFKFLKMYTTTSEFPWSTPEEPVATLKNCEGVKVKLGRVLKEDECLVKFYLFDPENFQPNKFLFDIVLDKKVTLAKTKSKVVRQLKRKCDIETEVSRIRLRELCQNKVDFVKSSHPIQDRSTIMCNGLELHVQILKESDPPSDQFTLLFIRRWHPSTASYGHLEEIRLPVTCSYGKLFEMISSSSGINFDNIEISYLNESGGFPFEYPKLKLLEEIRFHKIPSDASLYVSHHPLCLYHSGNLLYYRDSTEKLKTISDEERKQLQIQDSVRLRKASSFSFRKERALKIYTEISSSIKDDVEYDV